MTAIPVNSQGQTSTLSIAGRIKLVAASSIIMVFLASLFVYIQFSQLSPIQLYSENFNPVIDVKVERTIEAENYDNLTPHEILNSANLAFQDSNFGVAIKLIETVPDENKMPGMKYCGALSYMKVENFDRAKELLTQLGKVNDIVWQERSKWFLALCYLREDDSENAIKYLEDVSEIGGEYNEAAANLLKKVSK
jgi:hypothetical protein